MAAIDKSLYEKFEIENLSKTKTVDIKAGVISFNYYEDLFSPMITARIVVVNTGNTSVLNVGVVTANNFYGTFRGDGTNITDIGVTNVKNDGGDVKLQSNASGVSITGIATINQLNVTDLNVSGITTVGVVTGAGAIYYGDGSNLTGNAPGLTAAIGIQSAGNRIGAGITFLNIVGTGFTADATGQEANLYLPPPGVSLGLAIALGG